MRTVEIPEKHEPQEWLLLICKYRFFGHGTGEFSVNHPFAGTGLGEQVQNALKFLGEKIREDFDGWKHLPDKIEISLEKYDEYVARSNLK